MTISQHDLHMMALVIAGEARGEGWQGKIAVGHVIKNRLAKPGWWTRHEDTIPDDTLAATAADPFQFSCLNTGDPNLRYLAILPPTHPVYLECLCAALCVVTGKEPDPTSGSTHYFKTGSPEPKWARGKQPVVIIGSHRFFDDVR